MSILLDELLDFNLVKYKDRSLSALKDFAQAFDVLHWDVPVITVTGTNGKGSTVTALSKLYELNGYRVGVFTSPHLLSMHERIRVNQDFITTEQINTITKTLLNNPQIHEFTWFEVFLIISLLHFKQQNIDILILEVGVGGTYDATNIIDANIVIMTNVNFDHQDYLGDTLEEIGGHKAGLMRSHQKAIFAAKDCPKSVLNYAKHLDVDLKLYGRDFMYQQEQDSWSLSFDDKQFNFQYLPSIHLGAMAAAIYASYQLKDKLPVDETRWQKAQLEVFIPGRFQKIKGKNLLILDVGHNPHAAQLLYERLCNLNIAGKMHLIVSFLKDKDGKKVVKILKKLPVLWYPCVLDCERAMSENDLKDIFSHEYIHLSPEQALDAAREHAEKDDIIVAFGSFYTVSPLMKKLIREGYDVFRNHRTS
jgi:dihydrofolate synthase/folylpolyglutamate synthase